MVFLGFSMVFLGFYYGFLRVSYDFSMVFLGLIAVKTHILPSYRVLLSGSRCFKGVLKGRCRAERCFVLGIDNII